MAIVITHGLSGSGKSTFSKKLVEPLRAVRVRSDVERKRMHGMAACIDAAERPGSGLYDSATTAATYGRLRDIARQVIGSGMAVIVDAAFLLRAQRSVFAALAQELGVPFLILDMQADESTMRKRIASRVQLKQDASDAGLEVLEWQLTEHEPLTEQEGVHAIVVDSELCMEPESISNIVRQIARSLEGTRTQ